MGLEPRTKTPRPAWTGREGKGTAPPSGLLGVVQLRLRKRPVSDERVPPDTALLMTHKRSRSGSVGCDKAAPCARVRRQ